MIQFNSKKSSSVKWKGVGLSLLSIFQSGYGINLKDIDYVFSFGDSFTASPSSLTIPNIPSINTTSSGANTWIQYFTSSLPSKPTLLNFAQPGASISNAIVPDFGAQDFVSQVAVWKNLYGKGANSQQQWNGNNSLFTIWFGAEDMGYLYASQSNFINAQPYMLTTFDATISLLFAAGARNFLLLSVPPVWASPLVAALSPSPESLGTGSATTTAALTLKTAVDFYNGRFIVYADLLSTLYPGSISMWFDVDSMFETIFEEPSKYAFENVYSACSSYFDASNSPQAENEATCGAPLSAYFWRDNYHPSFTVHQLIANELNTLYTSNRTSIPPTQNGLPTNSTFTPPSSSSSISTFPISTSVSKSPTTSLLLTTSNPTPTSPSVNNAQVNGAYQSIGLGFTFTFLNLVLVGIFLF